MLGLRKGLAAGLGVVACSVADNQELNCAALAKHGVATLEQFDPNGLASAVMQALARPRANPFTAVLDGRGAERVADVVLSLAQSA